MHIRYQALSKYQAITKKAEGQRSMQSLLHVLPLETLTSPPQQLPQEQTHGITPSCTWTMHCRTASAIFTSPRPRTASIQHPPAPSWHWSRGGLQNGGAPPQPCWPPLVYRNWALEAAVYHSCCEKHAPWQKLHSHQLNNLSSKKHTLTKWSTGLTPSAQVSGYSSETKTIGNDGFFFSFSFPREGDLTRKKKKRTKLTAWNSAWNNTQIRNHNCNKGRWCGFKTEAMKYTSHTIYRIFSLHSMQACISEAMQYWQQ